MRVNSWRTFGFAAAVATVVWVGLYLLQPAGRAELNVPREESGGGQWVLPYPDLADAEKYRVPPSESPRGDQKTVDVLIHGRVLDVNSDPVPPGTEVRAIPVGLPADTVQIATSGASGIFRLRIETSVDARAYYLRAFSSDGAYSSRGYPVTVGRQSGSTDCLVLRLLPSSTVRGRVVDSSGNGRASAL